VLKKDFAPIQKISFSRLSVVDEAGTHYYAAIRKQFQFAVCRFTVPTTDNFFDSANNNMTITVKCSPYVRPFGAPISLLKWLNHSLSLVAVSQKDEARYWQVSPGLEIGYAHEGVLTIKSEKNGELMSMVCSFLSPCVIIFSLLYFYLYHLYFYLTPRPYSRP
jgi:hypothetical protein